MDEEAILPHRELVKAAAALDAHRRKVLGCQLIFEKESDRDHHLQRHLKQRSEERKQYAKRYVKNEMQATTGDDGKHLPAQVKSNCAPVETGVTSEGGHFVSIRLFD